MQLVEEDRNCEDQVVLAAYARDYSLEKGVSPLLAVFPKNKEDVKGIVRLANEYKVPLVAVSSGQPRFNGDTLPERESVIIDFRQMNRTIKIDSVNRCAIVEPGVTYAELIPQLEKQGLKLNIPFLPKASKSVVTSRLEREPVLIPKYQYDYI
ncbi:MAG TPA: FAD-binding oxidoreductase, partial [Dehalococcoidales bacterium]|nr:FAD-binding oxidoreductase [Dehalococcoidales bacterium]